MKSEGLILVNGEAADSIHALDRGLQYGDGVFRTLKADSGQLRWWEDQYRKLSGDCQALRIPCPAEPVLKAEADRVASVQGIGIVKIIVTRGAGPRGYRITSEEKSTRIVMGFAASHMIEDSVEARWCDLRLSHQPRLAGIKHLNRLENVLARSEWNDPAIAEGLLMDEAGQVIGGAMTNLFMVEKDTLVTPDLTNCGIAGVARARLLRAATGYGHAAKIEAITPERLLQSDQVLLCNSLIGIWRIEKLDNTVWPDNGWADKLKCWLDEDH